MDKLCINCGLSDTKAKGLCNRCYMEQYHEKNRVALKNTIQNGFKKPTHVICEVCGITIKVKPHESLSRRFCSLKCMGIHQSKNRVGKNAYRWGGGSIECICETCGKKYEVPNYHKENTRFCSRSCAGKICTGTNNPNYGNNWSTKARKHLSEIKKEQFKDKSFHPRWKGGVSFKPYCIKFNETFKESIRNEFNRVCFICGKNEKENGRRLDVHHVNYDKNCLCDDIKCKFIPLCQSCHGKTNSKREDWENTILNKLIEMECI